MYSPLLRELIEAFKSLPGIGPKSAQRMALQVLERNRVNGKRLAEALLVAIERVQHCHRCRMFSETDICALCQNSHRDSHLVCVVESPADMLAIELTGIYSGLYFVLAGPLSPIDGRGPKEIGIPELLKRIQTDQVREVILATNPTVEGEVTAQHLATRLRELGVPCSRLAHGIPMGGELEYLDGGTLTQAFMERRKLETVN